MDPYEKTAEEMKRQSESPKRFFKSALGVGSALGAATFIPTLVRAAPFLSKYIPENLAIKGLSKISPKFGNFIKDALGNGYDFTEIKDFIGKQLTDSEKGNQNLIQQYSPELFSFLDEEVKKGNSLGKASAEAYKKYKDIIHRMEKDHKMSFVDILEQIFGRETERQMSLKKFNQKKKGLVQQEEERFQNEYGPPVPNTPKSEGGPGQQALGSIMDRINQKLGI